MEKFLLLILKKSGIPQYEIASNEFPSGDSKVVIDHIDAIWFVVYLNERGVINSIDIYDNFCKLCSDLLQHKINIKY